MILRRARSANLPRHAINRLCVLHLTLGLMDAAADPICDGGLPPESKKRAAEVCCQIMQLCDRAKGMEPGDPQNPRLLNSINRMNAVILHAFSEGVDAREGIAMVMARVAEEEEKLSEMKAHGPTRMGRATKTLVWSQLHELLAALYDIIAPGKTDIEQINKGAAVAAGLCR